MARTTRAERDRKARQADERSKRSAKVSAATVERCYREAETPTVRMGDRISEDRRVDALRRLAADRLASMVEHGHADVVARTAERLGLTVGELEEWAGDCSAYARRRAMAAHRDEHAARVQLARALATDLRDAARLDRVEVEADARIARIELTAVEAVDAYAETTAERAERIVREGRATAPRPTVDPWAVLAAEIMGAMSPDLIAAADALA